MNSISAFFQDKLGSLSRMGKSDDGNAGDTKVEDSFAQVQQEPPLTGKEKTALRLIKKDIWKDGYKSGIDFYKDMTSDGSLPITSVFIGGPCFIMSVGALFSGLILASAGLALLGIAICNAPKICIGINQAKANIEQNKPYLEGVTKDFLQNPEAVSMKWLIDNHPTIAAKILGKG